MESGAGDRRRAVRRIRESCHSRRDGLGVGFGFRGDCMEERVGVSRPRVCRIARGAGIRPPLSGTVGSTSTPGRSRNCGRASIAPEELDGDAIRSSSLTVTPIPSTFGGTFYVVAVLTPVDADNRPDLSPIVECVRDRGVPSPRVRWSSGDPRSIRASPRTSAVPSGRESGLRSARTSRSAIRRAHQSRRSATRSSASPRSSLRRTQRHWIVWRQRMAA
jgi:hypothetical protein